jgi:hypothetical protein
MPALDALDHLLWGATDLDVAIDHIERLTGVRAAAGGRHPGEGTRNALLRLGPRSYLEIIAPDPLNPPVGRPRWLGLDTLAAPRLITWAASVPDIAARAAAARVAGVPLGDVREGRRVRDDGEALSWRLTYPDPLVGDGLVPFLIDGDPGPHPARTSPAGITLLDLRAEHPDPPAIAAMLLPLGIALRVTEGPMPALVATLDTPRGRIELR